MCVEEGGEETDFEERADLERPGSENERAAASKLTFATVSL